MTIISVSQGGGWLFEHHLPPMSQTEADRHMFDYLRREFIDGEYTVHVNHANGEPT